MEDNNKFVGIVLKPIFQEPCDDNQYYLEIRGFFTKEYAEKLKEQLTKIINN